MVSSIDKIILGVLVVIIIGMNAFLITAMNGGSGSSIDVSSQESDHITQDRAKVIATNAVPGSITEIELGSENGLLVYEVEITDNFGTITEVIIERSSGNIVSMEEEEDEPEDVPITGTPLEKASAAALAFIGEGRVTDSEIGDEEGYYEIEITLDNGSEVDVHLDENFNILSTEYD